MESLLLGDFLLKLNVLKAVGDVKSMTEMYMAYCEVGEEYLVLREEVLAKKKPRRIFVQAHTELVSSRPAVITHQVNEKVELTEFEPTPEGFIKSVLAHFPQNQQ